jgi:transcriptional regulator with GAF, ATPase, and Fis domain
MADKEKLSPDDIKAALTQSPEYSRSKLDLLEVPLGDGFDLEEHLNNIQRHYLRRAMQESGGIKTKAASLLGIKSYQAMDAQIKRLNVDLGGL